MKTITKSTCLAAVLTLTLAGAVLAQGGRPPQGGGMDPRMMGGGGPMQGPGQGPRGGMMAGTVKAVSLSSGTITLTGPMGDRHKIKVDDDTTIYGQKQVKVSDLKIGEKVQIVGPIEDLTTASIIVGDLQQILPPPPMGMGGPGGPGMGQGQPGFGGPGMGPGQPGFGGQGMGGPGQPGFGGPGGQQFRGQGGPGQGQRFGMGGPGQGPGFGGGPGGNRQGRPGRPPTGTITSVDPLTIKIGKSSITVDADKSDTVGKIVKQSIGDIKVGNRIMAAVQPEDEGAPTAMRIVVNLKLPGMGGPGGPGGPGFGGQGGPGGFGGPGGPGGPGFGGPGGPGGFGNNGPGGPQPPYGGGPGQGFGGGGGFGGPPPQAADDGDQGGPPPPMMDDNGGPGGHPPPGEPGVSIDDPAGSL